MIEIRRYSGYGDVELDPGGYGWTARRVRDGATTRLFANRAALHHALTQHRDDQLRWRP